MPQEPAPRRPPAPGIVQPAHPSRPRTRGTITSPPPRNRFQPEPAAQPAVEITPSAKLGRLAVLERGQLVIGHVVSYLSAESQARRVVEAEMDPAVDPTDAGFLSGLVEVCVVAGRQVERG